MTITIQPAGTRGHAAIIRKAGRVVAKLYAANPIAAACDAARYARERGVEATHG